MSLFTLFSGLLSRHFRQRSDDAHLRQELLAHRRRELLHRNIPDQYAVREAFGARFDELLDIVRAHDPGELGDAAADSPYYPELTRTLLYQLAPAFTEAQAESLLQQEVSLWFGYPLSRAGKIVSLSKLIHQWLISWKA